MNIESLASKVKFLDQQYREGKASVTDAVFNKLENNLRRVAPNDDYFNQKLVLPSLANGRPDEFLENLLPDTRLIICPKIDGCAIALSYENGSLVKAISRKGKNVSDALKTVKNVPHTISTKATLHVRGELFGPALEPARSQRLAAGLLRKAEPTGEGLAFCAFQILNGELNYFSSLEVLQKLGFEIPEAEHTNFTSDIEMYRQLWKEGKLFSSYPTDGIVLSVNNRKLQKQLENKYSTCPRWQYAIKD